MKKILINVTKALLPLLVLGVVASCDDEKDYGDNSTFTTNTGANIKFINAAIGPVTGTTAASVPVNYFLNSAKVTAVNVTSPATGPALLPIGFGFGGIAPNNTNYAIVPQGVLTMEAISPLVTTTTVPPLVTPAVTVTKQDITVETGKYYSSFLVGTAVLGYKNYFITDDYSVATNPDLAYVRFINTIANTPVGGYTMVITKTKAATATSPAVTKELLRFTGVNYLTGSTVFVPIEANKSDSSDTYRFEMFQGTTPIANIPSIVPRGSRVYTLFSRGSVGLTGSAAPSFTFYTNR